MTRAPLCLVLIVACAPSSSTGLVIDRVDPPSAPNIDIVPVRLEGSFHMPITSNLDEESTVVGDLAVTIGGVALGDAVWRGEELIEGSIPAGLPVGRHDVTVTLGGRTDVLVDGYAVLGPDMPDAGVVAPDAPLIVPCMNGVRDAGEVGIDCGGTCASACVTLFEPDPDTLAVFELNGDVLDTSGNQRNATPLGGGSFVTTAWGKGMSISSALAQGLQWNAYAGLITHPYTIEMVVTPSDTSCYRKLFGDNDTSDAGWYYCGRFEAYPYNWFGPFLTANQRHYFAMVSTSPTQITVYVNGTNIGTTNAAISTPPSAAIFFRDDTFTSRMEGFSGVVDAIRISRVARTAAEIGAVHTKLATQP